MEGTINSVYEKFQELKTAGQIRNLTFEEKRAKRKIIEQIFIRASGLKEYAQDKSSNREYYSKPSRWDRHRFETGVIKFKRKAMGFFGKYTTKSLEELTELLCNTNIASSQDEGTKLIPCLDGLKLAYGLQLQPYLTRNLVIQSLPGQAKYKISIQN